MPSVPYQFLRVFFAAPIEMDDELQAFQDALSQVNEKKAMPAGLLLVPASLTRQMGDKRFFQPAVEDNIRDASLFILVLKDSWGPDARNFRADYQLAMACRQDTTLPMQAVIVLFDKTAAPRSPALDGVDGTEYEDLEQFLRHTTRGLESLVASIAAAAGRSDGVAVASQP